MLWCDNVGALYLAANAVFRAWTKHVEIDRHFIKEKIEGGEVQVMYTPTSLQIADILIKALPRKNFEDLSSKLGMNNILSLA